MITKIENNPHNISISTVVLLHGLYMKPFVMRKFAAKLRRLGYRVELFGYKSKNFEAAATMRALSQKIDLINSTDIYLVGHSMGGLVARMFYTLVKPLKVKKIVTLGTPHQGSFVAKYLSTTKLKPMLGSSGESGLTTPLPNWSPDIPLGCIVGVVGLGGASLLAPWHKNRAESDGTVFVSEAMLPNAADHTFVKAAHTTMLFSPAVFSQCAHFLQNGLFKSAP